MDLKSIAATVTLAMATASAPAATVVFSTDFDGALPSQIDPGNANGGGFLTAVQGFSGLGPAGGTFGGNMLRSPTGNTVTLTLTGLPAHDTISLRFLFAAIDSLDGTGEFPQGDFFKIVFDGSTLFSESFANATASQTQSYVPPPGVELARRQQLGFSSGEFYADSAYDFGADPRFLDFAHSGSSATIQFFVFGPGNQSLDDESWGMDNLTVSVSTVGRPTADVALPGSLALLGLGLAGFGLGRRARR